MAVNEAKVMGGSGRVHRNRERFQVITSAFDPSGQRTAVVAGEGARTFWVPRLAIRGPNGQLELFEAQFMESPWSLIECDHRLSAIEFPTEAESGKVLSIDVSDKGKLEVQFAEHLRRQVGLFGREPGWDIHNLTNWLDRSFPHRDILPVQSRLFILHALESLRNERQFTVEQLARHKYALRNALHEKIGEHRRGQYRKAYQQLLFDSGKAAVRDEPGYSFEFTEETYAPDRYYERSHRFQKRLCLPIGELETDGKQFECEVEC